MHRARRRCMSQAQPFDASWQLSTLLFVELNPNLSIRVGKRARSLRFTRGRDSRFLQEGALSKIWLLEDHFATYHPPICRSRYPFTQRTTISPREHRTSERQSLPCRTSPIRRQPRRLDIGSRKAFRSRIFTLVEHSQPIHWRLGFDSSI